MTTSTERLDWSERLGCSVSEAAQAMGVSKPTLYKMLESGQLKYCQIGDRKIVSVKSLRELAGESDAA